MNCNRILFVDIDGCLTSIETGTYFATEQVKYGPSERIVNKVTRFCRDNDAKVIISSNWRKFKPDGIWKNSYGIFHNPMNKVIQALEDCYIGTLPKFRHIKKSEALIIWIEQNNYTGKFAIFDDDLNENYQNTDDYSIKDHFILIDSQIGISDRDLIKAKGILDHERQE